MKEIYKAKHLVFVGGGHTHALVIKRLAMHPIGDLYITLISAPTHTPYSGMLPGYVAATYDFDETHIDLSRLAMIAGASFIRDRVTNIDYATKTISMADHPDLSFDYASIDIGSSPTMNRVEGARENAVGVKPIDKFLTRIDRLEKKLAGNSATAKVTVVGAGAGGFELVHALRERFGAKLELTLVHGGDGTLGSYPKNLRRKAERSLQSNQITCRYNCRVERVDPNSFITNTGESIAFDEIIFATEAAAAPWLKNTNLPLTEKGFIRTNEFLQVEDCQNMFACGDCATNSVNPHPKAGVYAVRQAPVLYDNMIALLTEEPLRVYKPQNDFLSLLKTTNGNAIGSRRPFTMSGKWVWRLKDSIDRKFMQQFTDMEPMVEVSEPPTLLTQEAREQNKIMHCQGCAAKASHNALSRSVGKFLDISTDAAKITPPPGTVLIQSNDLITAPISDLYLFGRLTAVHATNDVICQGSPAHSALVNISLPKASDAVRAGWASQIEAGINDTLEEMGAKIIGGHTSASSTFMAGLSVNAFAKEDDLWRASAIEEGDAIILSKPIGTGVLLRGHMLGLTKGRWLDDALAQMTLSHHHLLTPTLRNKVKASTDITGYGTLSHLANLVAPSGLGLKINLSNIPLYMGVEFLINQGITSTVASSNAQITPYTTSDSARSSFKLPLLFDPQTSGPLALVCKNTDATEIIAELKGLGFVHAAAVASVIPAGSEAAPKALIVNQMPTEG